MTRVAPVIVALALLVGSSGAPTAEEVISVYTVGIGISSCASWLSDPQTTAQGENWILGAWTGMNFKNKGSHQVGSSSDGNGIIAEVKLLCRSQPSLSLSSATMQTFIKLDPFVPSR